LNAAIVAADKAAAGTDPTADILDDAEQKRVMLMDHHSAQHGSARSRYVASHFKCFEGYLFKRDPKAAAKAKLKAAAKLKAKSKGPP
jgi:hypothetical protein